MLYFIAVAVFVIAFSFPTFAMPVYSVAIHFDQRGYPLARLAAVGPDIYQNRNFCRQDFIIKRPTKESKRTFAGHFNDLHVVVAESDDGHFRPRP